MNVQEALHELGIDPSCTHEEARRAYLRLIKTRKPEVDPDGFRRAREAYELVKEALERGLSLEAQAAPPQGEDEEPEEPSYEEEEDDDQLPPELAALAARLSALPAATHREERLEVLRQAVRDHPGSSGPLWWLVQELEQDDRHDEVLEALRLGAAAGFSGFLELLLIRFPVKMWDADLDRLAVSLDGLLDFLQENPRGVPSAPARFARGILILDSYGRPEQARSLHGRAWAWLTTQGDAGILKAWHADWTWRIAHELGTVDPGFPLELRQAAARMALTRDVTVTENAARAYRKENDHRAEKVSEMLYDLPILYDLMYRTLQGLGRPEAIFTAHQDRNPLWIALMVLWVVGLAVARLGSNIDLDDFPPPQEQVRDYAASRVSQKVDPAWAALRPWCNGTDGDRLPLTACSPAYEAVQSLKKGNCPEARLSLWRMNEGLRDASALQLARATDFQREINSAMDSYCLVLNAPVLNVPGSSPSPPPSGP